MGWLTSDILHLSRGVHVALRERAVSLPQTHSRPERRVGLPALALLVALVGNRDRSIDQVLSSVAASCSVPRARLDALLDEFDARGYLRSDPSPVEDAPPMKGVEHDDALFVLPRDDDSVLLPQPTTFAVVPGGFHRGDHRGLSEIVLTPDELMAASCLTSPGTADAAWHRYRSLPGASRLKRSEFLALTPRLARAGALTLLEDDDPALVRIAKADANRSHERHRLVELHEKSQQLGQTSIDQELMRQTPPRVAVVGVNDLPNPPLSLGMLFTYAMAFEGGRLTEHYRFHPQLLFDEVSLATTAATPAIYLFSNYLWCSTQNLRLSALIKEQNPSSVIIHGGPNTPKYDKDVERYFHDHPHVDVTVRGEGEETLARALDALQGWDGDGPADLEVLRDVAGLDFRSSSGHVQTSDRERLSDLDAIPSPFLLGLFDSLAPTVQSALATVETNRGCPYGCTFCDWGSATLSRIRKFDMGRVSAELEWVARNEFPSLYIADANFGIFERDVEIAEQIAELKLRYGFPLQVGTNYAKNTTKHLTKIIRILTGAGILSEGKVSKQTMDTETLQVIRRKNIKVEKYDALTTEFQGNGLPMQLELMMGLPGATVDSFRRDLQDAVDRDIRTSVYPTVLLPNSPMNEPTYREENKIQALPGELVRETSSFSSADWEHMLRLNHVFGLCDNVGMLRHVSLFVRGETGLHEIDFYEGLLDVVSEGDSDYPVLRYAFDTMPLLMIPPSSWKELLHEVRSYLVERLAVTDGSALDSVIDIQHAHLPSRDRRFPDVVELSHDYIAWHDAVQEARATGHRGDWERVVPPLVSFGPGTVTVRDPHQVCAFKLVAGEFARMSPWEFESPVARHIVSGAELADSPAS